MPLFNWHDEPITLHSGQKSHWKVDCDALTDADWDAIAAYIYHQMGVRFETVVGVPEGGLKLARALCPYESTGPVLLVDDVLTTGESMDVYRDTFMYNDHVIGVVLFARGECLDWITPIWRMD